jgi:hypothetical protein
MSDFQIITLCQARLSIPVNEREIIIRNLIEIHKTDTLFAEGGKCSNVPLRFILIDIFGSKF